MRECCEKEFAASPFKNAGIRRNLLRSQKERTNQDHEDQTQTAGRDRGRAESIEYCFPSNGPILALRIRSCDRFTVQSFCCMRRIKRPENGFKAVASQFT